MPANLSSAEVEILGDMLIGNYEGTLLALCHGGRLEMQRLLTKLGLTIEHGRIAQYLPGISSPKPIHQESNEGVGGFTIYYPSGDLVYYERYVHGELHTSMNYLNLEEAMRQNKKECDEYRKEATPKAAQHSAS